MENYIRLSRPGLNAPGRVYKIQLDGFDAGKLGARSTIDIPATEGTHTIAFCWGGKTERIINVTLDQENPMAEINVSLDMTGKLNLSLISGISTASPQNEIDRGFNPKKKIGCLSILGIVFICIIFISILGQNGNSSGKSTTPEVSKKEEAHEMTPQKTTKTVSPLDDDVIDVDISNCNVRYLRHEILNNLAGDKCIAVYYEFTNNSDSDKAFYVTVTDKAFQDGVELKSSIFHVNEESHDSSAEIKPGVTVTICSGFVLRNDYTDVEIEVEPWINFSKNVYDKMVLSIS